MLARFITLICVLALLALILIAAGTPESPVQLQDEPHHHLKFENQYVRVWDTLIPAHEATLWHVHSHDNVVLTLGDANVRVETVGADPAESQPKLGDVGFRKAPYTHRTMSVGETPFHNMAIEILASPKKSESIKDEGRPPLLDNDLARVYRISLAPGESTGIQTSLLPGLLVAITAGDVRILQKNQTQSNANHLKAADVQWHETSVSRSIQNVGKARFEAVDIELK